ncbi:radical SAM protein [Streptomyces carpaticus]|uniref:Radical SAM protein n=1 Tax=Streptomyces carpaticus TaxID=285558 RepID=A0ABV4ZJ61_9ACTN
MTITEVSPTAQNESPTKFLWLDITRKCQLECAHCYNSSGPEGDHGSMSQEDWFTLLDQAADAGVSAVQLIGGEVTMHPHGKEIAAHALGLGLQVEVYSNLVHIAPEWWTLLQHEGASLATSYYSASAREHNTMTRRPSHGRTRANIVRALKLGIPLRVGIVSNDKERAAEAEAELRAIGVQRIGIDHIRPYGRGAAEPSPDTSGLCGNCGDGCASIGPNGQVAPCVFSTWMEIGNVQQAPLAAILSGDKMIQATAAIRGDVTMAKCQPDCQPHCVPNNPCDPRCEPNAACRPGTPPSDCQPRN